MENKEIKETKEKTEKKEIKENKESKETQGNKVITEQKDNNEKMTHNKLKKKNIPEIKTKENKELLMKIINETIKEK